MSYSVGHKALDEQHKKLLQLCRKISECQQENTLESIEKFHAILNDLAAYAGMHFHCEEEILIQTKYPLIDGQIADHEGYREKLTDFLVLASTGLIDKSGLSQYLETWWINHILESDMQYKRYM